MKERNRMFQKVLLIGGGAREHAIGEALCRSGRVELVTLAHNHNPGLSKLSHAFVNLDEKDVNGIVRWAEPEGFDFAVIGLEDPLAVGLPDALRQIGIPTVGPDHGAARVETSKLFTRDLMRKYQIPGRVEYRYFTDPTALAAFLKDADQEFALKPVGLTAGKGVRVMGEQLGSVDEAIEYGQTVIESELGGVAGVVVEERLRGQEFTLQAFTDGNAISPMPLVKDYKRAFEGDHGPNTGSMGSYSQSDGLLPFVDATRRDEALKVLESVVHALKDEGHTYQGIMYGQFMMTEVGAKLIEINARFGDPEAVNVLPLLENDFVDVCRAIIDGSLADQQIQFSRSATVCKYITPPDYGLAPEVGVPIRLDREAIESLGVMVFFAKVDERDGEFLTTTSRSIALVGIADTVEEAESAVEASLQHVDGNYHLRHDIARDYPNVASVGAEKSRQLGVPVP